MKPLHDNIIVEIIEEEGILKIVNDQYIVVRIKTLPDINPEFPLDSFNIAGTCEKRTIKEGNKILVDFIKDYMVDNEKIYIVRYKDILCVL